MRFKTPLMTKDEYIHQLQHEIIELRVRMAEMQVEHRLELKVLSYAMQPHWQKLMDMVADYEAKLPRVPF